MLKNTTISNSKKVPRALIITIVMVFLTEWFLVLIRPDLVKDYWNKFIINERVLIDMKRDYDYVIMGNSLQKTGIRPALISDNLLSLGLPGSKPMGLYILLKRYLEHHKPPKVIFVYVDPEDAHESLFVILRYFITMPEFLSLWKDLAWSERYCFIMSRWVSLTERQVRAVKRDTYPYSNTRFIKQLIENQGYMPSPRSGDAISNNYFLTHHERYQAGVSISKTDIWYLDKFMALASSKDIKVVFLGILLPRELHNIFEGVGFNQSYVSFLEGLKRRYPSADFVENPIQYLNNEYFGDQSHVNKKGSDIYTEYFKTKVFMPYAAAYDRKGKTD